MKTRNDSKTIVDESKSSKVVFNVAFSTVYETHPPTNE